jgi:hypothetical protein
MYGRCRSRYGYPARGTAVLDERVWQQEVSFRLCIVGTEVAEAATQVCPTSYTPLDHGRQRGLDLSTGPR